jgi:hypothetical protein
MTDTRTETTCDGCGQTDDHPKLRTGTYLWQKDDRTSVADPDFHFDCIPDALVTEFGLADNPRHAVTMAAREKALDGVHGDKLVAFIEKQPSDNDIDATTEES